MKSKKILENLIYLAIFLLPLYLVRIKIWFFPANVWEIMLAVIFISWIFLDKEKIEYKEFFLHYKKYIIAGSLMLAGILLATFISGNHLESGGIIKSWFLAPIIFMLLIGRILKKEKINQIFLVYFLSAVSVAIISIGYLIANQLTYDGRLSGIFNSPNYLAMYLAPAAIIFAFQEKKKLKLILPLVAILVALYLTYSYAAWISIIAPLIIIALIKKQISLKKISIVTAIIVVLFLSQINNKKFTDLLSANPRSSLASRIMIWKSSAKMIENNFWFGIGSGNFQRTYLEYQKFYPPYLEWAVPHPNNLYLTFWLYGGILGLAGFLSLVIFFFQNILSKINPHTKNADSLLTNGNEENFGVGVKKEPNQILFIALGIMLVILIHGIFDTTYFKNDLAIVFWLNFLALKDK
jgi:O-antigen ligase